MTVKFQSEDKAGALVRPGERLFLDSDQKRIVKAGDPSARYLFCTEKQKVPRKLLESFDTSAIAGEGQKKSPKKRSNKRDKQLAEDKSAESGGEDEGDGDG